MQLRLLQGLRSAVMDNIRRRIVGVMFPPSIFEDRCVDFRRSMIDVSTFEDRRSTHRIGLRRSTHPSPKVDTSVIESRHFDLRRSTHRDIDLRRATQYVLQYVQYVQYSTYSTVLCRPSKIDVTMCPPSEIDVSTFDDRRVDLRRWMC